MTLFEENEELSKSQIDYLNEIDLEYMRAYSTWYGEPLFCIVKVQEHKMDIGKSDTRYLCYTERGYF